MNLREVMRRALNDPLIDLPVLHPDYTEKIKNLIAMLGPEDRISEWKHTFGEARYEYHIHSGDTAKIIEAFFMDGVRGGHPTLTGFYSKEDLESFITDQTDASYS